MEIQIFKSVPFTTTPKGEKKGQECSALNNNGDIVNTVKKSFLYKVIYKLNIISIKIPKGFLQIFFKGFH